MHEKKVATAIKPGDFHGQNGVVIRSGGFIFSETSYQIDETSPLHDHALPHLCYVVGGRYQEILGRNSAAKTFERESPNVLFMPAGIPHSQQHYAPGRHFIIEACEEKLEELGCDIIRPLKLAPPEPEFYMHRIFREYAHPVPDSEFMLIGLAYVLFGLLHKDTYLAQSKRDGPDWLRKIRSLMDHEFLRPWTLDTLSQEASIDPEHLTSQFSHIYGSTPAEYLRKLRVKYACKLIQSTNMPLPEVALSAGFADQAHFSRTFRYHMGVTPLSFSRMARGLAPRSHKLPLRKAKIDAWDEYGAPDAESPNQLKVLKKVAS
jgi:AraC family transcriptional regulator